jgi:uncharacterized membrane protein
MYTYIMEEASPRRTRNIVHDSFVVGVVLKGLNGLAELVGAIALFFTTPEAIRSFIRALTLHELTEDPHDVIANVLLNAAKSFSVSTQVFGILYLAIHGVVKLFLVIMLLRRKYWAYPVAIAVFSVFIIYQMYQYTISHAIGLVALSIIDIAVIALTIVEYHNVRTRLQQTIPQ